VFDNKLPHIQCRRSVLLYSLTPQNFKKISSEVPDTRGWTFKLRDLDASINTLGALERNKAVLLDLIP